MRKVRYSVAASLDGYIAGPKGEADWIIMDPEIDFRALFDQFDTMLIGRRTFEPMVGKVGKARGKHAMRTLVFSRTLRQSDFPDVTIVSHGVERTVKSLREESGKDIWLFGGGQLFGSLLDAGLVDGVHVAVIPVLLGEGIPLLAPPAARAGLTLTGHRLYEKTGIVSVDYEVQQRKKG